MPLPDEGALGAIPAQSWCQLRGVTGTAFNVQ
jgi:hypothetical protein